MKKKLLKLLSLAMVATLILPGYTPASASESTYPEITAVQNDEGTFVNMNGTLICELEENRYLRFRSSDTEDNWIGSEAVKADLCVGYSDNGVIGIIIENAEFVNNESEGWFEISVSGYKDGLDCKVNYSIRGSWDASKKKFRYTYKTNMDANLEKWYENSISAQNSYKNDPNSSARIEITDYFIEHISYPMINRSESYGDMPLRYEYFFSSHDGGNTWKKSPKIHIPEPIRSGNYVTIVDKSQYFREGSVYGFTDYEHGGWKTTITETSANIWYSICWYFWDVHIFAMDAVPPRGSAERFELSYSLDFDTISPDEGKEIINSASENNWRELEEYQLPLFKRNNTFDTLICDSIIPSDETAEHNIWWASSYDCYRDDTVGYDDSYSVTIKREGNPVKPAAWNTFMWGPEVEKDGEPIKNHKYRLSAMVKTENCTGDVRIGYATRSNEGDFFYGTDTHNNDGTPITDGNISWHFTKAITGTNDWTELSMEFIVTKRRNSILLEQNGSGQCWFDNVVLEDLGEITNDDYYVYESYEEEKGDWKTVSNSDINIADGAFVLTPDTVGSEIAQVEHNINAYGGRWVAEFEASATTTAGTLMACLGTFNLEVWNGEIIIKTSNSAGNSVRSVVKPAYTYGTPVKFRAVIDYDTKEFEFYCDGQKSDLGEGNYIRTQSVSELQRFVTHINAGYSGNIKLYDFMLYSDSDAGSVNISRAKLNVDDAAAYKDNIILPADGVNGTKIQWSSSDESVVKNDGTICRSDKTGYAVLTAALTKNDKTGTKKFPVRVAPYEGISFNIKSITTYSDRTVANIAVANDSADTYVNPALILACYKGDELIGTSIENVDLNSNTTTHSITATHAGNTDTAKIFLWDMETLFPISQELTQTFSSQIIFEIEKACAETGESVNYEVYKVHGESKVPLQEGEYSIEQSDLTVDYGNKTITFLSEGIKNVKLTVSGATYIATVVVNDSSSKVSVKGSSQFDSDFTTDTALSTYLAAGSSGYTITTQTDGTKALSTVKSTAVDTLLFGPELADYSVEMEFTPTKLSGSGVNYLGIGLRAQDKAKPPAYRVGVFERDTFRGTELLYNRLGIGRGEKPLSGAWHYGNISANPFNNGNTFALNEKYKLSASIIGDRISGILYDKDGNVIDSISSTVNDCNFSESGNPTATMTSGKTILSFQCMVADICDIKIFDFDEIGKINIVPSSDTVNVGDSINLRTLAGLTELDNGMVKYTAVSGLDIKGSTAVATSSGTHTVIAEYTDYSGKIKYSAIRINVN